MTDVLLVLLDQPDTGPAVLQAAEALGASLGGAAFEVLIVRTPPEATIMPSEEVLTTQRAAAIRAQETARAAALTAAFERWRQAAGRAANLSNVEAAIVDVVAQRGAGADFIVAARTGEPHHGTERAALHAALFATGRPVLLVPPGPAAPFGRTVAVAWRDDGRAIKAVLPVLRLLTAAAQVHVLQGVRDQPATRPVPAVFREHGISAAMHVLRIGDGLFGQELLDQAHALGADLLVMGAYGHHPLREMIFGGVTRFMLDHADLPLLLRH